jgi:hypothetical protein
MQCSATNKYCINKSGWQAFTHKHIYSEWYGGGRSSTQPTVQAKGHVWHPMPHACHWHLREFIDACVHAQTQTRRHMHAQQRDTRMLMYKPQHTHTNTHTHAHRAQVQMLMHMRSTHTHIGTTMCVECVMCDV